MTETAHYHDGEIHMEKECTKGPAYEQARYERDMYCEDIGSDTLFEDRHCLQGAISYIVDSILVDDALQNNYSRGKYPECKISARYSGDNGIEDFIYSTTITSLTNDPMLFLRNDIRAAFSTAEIERVEIKEVSFDAPKGFEIYILDIVGSIKFGNVSVLNECHSILDDTYIEPY